MIIAPSILAADFARLGEEVEAVLAAGADWVHVDVMDGQFVPNITMGPLVVSALRKRVAATLDVHLMIHAPERYVDAFAQAGADRITVHVEATPHVHRALQAIRQHGLRTGIAFNPATSLDALDYVAADVDLVLIMTINPGFGGQRLIPAMVDKVAAVRHKLQQLGRSDVDVQVDGGIDPSTAPLVVDAGANVLVAGTAIFGAADYATAISALRHKA